MILFRFARFGRFGGFISAVSLVSFRWFRFVVSGFSTCPAKDHTDPFTRFLATESNGKLLLKADNGKYLSIIQRFINVVSNVTTSQRRAQ